MTISPRTASHSLRNWPANKSMSPSSTARGVFECEWSVPDDFPFMSETLPAWVIRLPRWLFRGEHRTVIVNFNLWWRLIRLRPDVVVGYAYSLPAWTAFVYSRLFKIPYVAWSTDTPHTASRPDRVQRFSRRKIIGSAALCLTPSLQGRQQFLSYGAPTEQIRVAAQSVSCVRGASLAGPPVGEAYIQRHQLTGRTILYVGFLTRSKGVDDLVRAFGRLAKDLTDVQLLLVGSGPLTGTSNTRHVSSGSRTECIWRALSNPTTCPGSTPAYRCLSSQPVRIRSGWLWPRL